MQQSVEHWNHLISNHTPYPYNEHAYFQKGHCTVQLYMGTNCGIYWVIVPCKKINCQCAELDQLMRVPLDEDELADPTRMLIALHEKGYQLTGWNNEIKYTEQTCQCHNPNSTERVFYTFHC